MIGRKLRCLLLSLPFLVGCGAIRTGDGWWDDARRQLGQVVSDIKADLDFHDDEGLESFSPDAAEHVKAMRRDMNGEAGISR